MAKRLSQNKLLLEVAAGVVVVGGVVIYQTAGAEYLSKADALELCGGKTDSKADGTMIQADDGKVYKGDAKSAISDIPADSKLIKTDGSIYKSDGKIYDAKEGLTDGKVFKTDDGKYLKTDGKVVATVDGKASGYVKSDGKVYATEKSDVYTAIATCGDKTDIFQKGDTTYTSSSLATGGQKVLILNVVDVPAATAAPTATPIATAKPASATATPVATAKTTATRATATPAPTVAPTATPVATPNPTAAPTATPKPTAAPVVSIKSATVNNKVETVGSSLFSAKKDNTLILSGEAPAGSSIVITLHSTPRQYETTVDNNGHWTIIVDKASVNSLEEGDHTVTVAIKDAAGKPGTPVTVGSFKLVNADSPYSLENPVFLSWVLGGIALIAVAGLLFMRKLRRNSTTLK